ncbi:Patatin [Ceratocystis platani]|uniref:Patatin n=1 Tax=Ceratocystis fimbriata f. sp. platani TaxID=88771 RepID=A0A0F8DCD6_CERFI|nr:Patatin [Ceratocystis platani]
MSSATQPSENAQPFKILSLDDGGVGGLSSLLILENIMENIQKTEGLDKTPRPCERFDLIGGTGTGGIVAIMLGRLERNDGKSTVDTCQHENEKFLHKQCVNTVVLATTKVDINAAPILFRTYQATTGWSECKIWEVARATSAMANLFKPIKLGRDNEKFMNSSFGHSNPCKILIKEATTLLSDQQEMLILSIGTGFGGPIEMGNTKRSIRESPASVYYLPFRENSKFIGRQDILSKLDDMLFTQAGFQQVALVGLGGMGKTQVALKFVCMVKVKYTDYSVFWVTAASMDGFRNSCKELTAALNIEASDSEDPRRLVKNYLDADKCGKWLLILDNVDDTSLFNAAAKEDRISSYLPQSEQGRVMITTRSKKVAWLAVEDDNLELGEMSSDDLTSMLIRGVKGLSDDLHDQNKALINEILNELCRLPLAIAQAADYMAVKQISIAEYLELLRESNEDKIDLLKYSHMDIMHPEISQSAVATTWLITFQQIRKSSPDAVNLLRFIAKVEPKAIPQTMLPGSDKKKSLVDAIGILLDYGFISRRKEPKMFDMHSLVHLTTQLWFKGLKDEEKYMHTVVMGK